MAAELCKVSLWMEAQDPGKPLSFLDHHIQVGNSLLGTTPRLMAEGIPNDAFKAIEGDDKKTASEMAQAKSGKELKQREAGLMQLGFEQAPGGGLRLPQRFNESACGCGRMTAWPMSATRKHFTWPWRRMTNISRRA